MATRGAEAARPGQTYFVPGVRIVPIAPLTRAQRPGCTNDSAPTDPPALPDADTFGTVAEDIIKVDVTLVANGSGEYSIELNNAFTELPADRNLTNARHIEAWPDGRPFTPRFKYNDFALFNFGMRLRIDMRYWPDPADPEADEAASHRWVPMIQGPITDMRFSFGTGEGARLTITGEDDLAPLKDKNCRRHRYSGDSEQEVVRSVLNRAQYTAIPLATHDNWPPFATDRSRALADTHQEGQAYLEYLQKVAEKLDFEVFLAFDGDPPTPASPLKIHFEPSRCRLPPGTTRLNTVYILEHAKNLLSFSPTIKMRDLYSSVTVRGRHRVPGTAERVDGVVGPDDHDLAQELFRLATDPPLVAGPDWRTRLYGANCQTDNNRTNVDNERAELMARAAYRKKAREFLKIRAETIGLPRLRPGRYVEVRGMRPPFDGFYYVEKSVHKYSVQGYRTEIDARRPGMPAPPYGETREEE